MNTKPAPSPLLKNAAAAPFVYFDGAPVFGTVNGIVSVELAAQMLQPKPDGSVSADFACVAHLRCSAIAATNLRDALSQALDMLAGNGNRKN